MSRRNRDTSVLRLEVATPDGWTNVLGPTSAIELQRNANLEPGMLAASIHDATLDPSKAPTLRAGAIARLMVEGLAGWRPVGTFTTSTAKTTYARPGKGKPSKRAHIALAAEDSAPRLASSAEQRSVATVDELRTLLAAGGVAYRVNGTTAAGPAEPTVVAVSPEASLADQVVITRDTTQGFAWIAADGVLEVWDRDAVPTAPVAVWTDRRETGLSWSDMALTYDSTDVVDEVTVEFLRYKPVSNAVETITYGPYRRDGATGSNALTVQYVSDVEDETAIEAFARDIMARVAEPQMRPESMTVLVRTAQERDAVADMEPNALVGVRSYADDLDVIVRVDTIEHSIEVVSRDEFVWRVTFTFDPPEAVVRRTLLDQGLPVSAAVVLDRLEATELMAAGATASAATAQSAAADAKVTAQSAEDGRTGNKASTPRTAVSGARAEMGADDNGGYFGVRDALNRFLGLFQIRTEDGVTRLSLGTGAIDGADPVRFRFRISATERVIEALTAMFEVFGIVKARGITLLRSPAVLTGIDGFTGVKRTTSNDGIVQVQHNVNTRGLRCAPFVAHTNADDLEPGQSAVGPSDVDMVLDGTEAGGIVRFRVEWRGGTRANRPQGVSAGDPVVNRVITFDWPILAIDR